MVKTEQNYSYKHFVFKVENPNINKFLTDINECFYAANYDKPIYAHAKTAEIVTTENGYTIIIFEYERGVGVNIDDLMAKYKEYTKETLETLVCPDCERSDFWPISGFCKFCFTEGREIKGVKNEYYTL